jgi:hypothetical protein
VFEHVAGVRFGGRLPQPGQPGRLAVVAALQQIVEAMPVPVRQRLGQGFIDAPVGASDGLGTGALDGVERGQDDRLPPQMLNQGAGQHDAFVGLHGQLGQRVDGLPVVAHGERLEAEHRLQLDQVLAPGLLPLPVVVPAFDADLELVGDQFQQGRERRLIDAKDDAGKAQVAKLHGKAQPIRRPAPLPDDGEIGIAERVIPDQIVLGVRQRQQAFPLGGGQYGTTRHIY